MAVVLPLSYFLQIFHDIIRMEKLASFNLHIVKVSGLDDFDPGQH